MALILRGRTTLAGATTVGWSPAALFANGEQGAWFDPSDFARYMAPSDTELVFNGDFNDGTTGWSATSGTLTEVGGRLRVTNGTFARAKQSITTIIGKWYRISAEVYGPTASIVRVGTTSEGSDLINISGAPSNTVAVFLATTTTTYLSLWLNSSAAGAYGDFDNISVRELPNYSTATMFTDTAGTTPVTAVGQSVALMLDRSRGAAPGAELSNLSAATFTAGAALVNATTFTLSHAGGGAANFVTNMPAGAASLTIGKLYLVTVTTSGYSGEAVKIKNLSSDITVVANGSITVRMLATQASVFCRADSGASPISGTVVVSFKEIPGNHATQATAANRPVLQAENGRYYLSFDGTDDFLSVSAMTLTQPISAFVGGHILGATTFQRFFDGAIGGSRVLIGRQSTTQSAIFAGGTPLNFTDTFVANVYTGLFNGASSVGRLGGVQVVTGDAGANGVTGLTLGAMLGGSSERLNGRIYSLLVRGATTSATDIARTERYVANRTGVVLP